MQTAQNFTPNGNIPNAYDIPGIKIRIIRLWPIFFILILLIIIMLGIYLIIPKTSITVGNQPLKNTVFIKKLVLLKGGFVVIRPANKYNKPLFKNIGYTDYLPPDTYADFYIDIFPEGSNEDNYTIKPGDLLFAIVFEDKDNDFKWTPNDFNSITKDWLGRQIIKPFKVK